MNNLKDFKYPEWGEQFPGMIPKDLILDSAMEDGGIGWKEPQTSLWSGVVPKAKGIVDVTPAFLKLVDGEEYTLIVTIDGVTKQFTNTATTSQGEVILAGTDVLSFFSISYLRLYGTYYNTVSLNTTLSNDVQVSISLPEKVHKIDDDFLPESGAVVPQEDADILRNSISNGGMGWTEPGTELWSGTIEIGTDATVTPAFLEFEDGETVTLQLTVDGNTVVDTATASDHHGLNLDFETALIILWYDATTNTNTIGAVDGSVSHTVTISTPDTVHKIDEEFLPESGVFVVTFRGDNSEHTAACDKTWAEIYAAYTAGQQMVVCYDDSTNLYTCNAYVTIMNGSFQALNGTYLTYRPTDDDFLSINFFVDDADEPSVAVRFVSFK